MTTANINPAYAHMSEAEMAANQRMLTEAKAAQADPRAGRKRGQLNAFYWRTEADFGGSVCELHHDSLTAAMESYGYADQRGVPVILSAVINDVPYVAKASGGSTVAPPWMQVLVSDTSHIERVEARKASA